MDIVKLKGLASGTGFGYVTLTIFATISWPDTSTMLIIESREIEKIMGKYLLKRPNIFCIVQPLLAFFLHRKE
jgi:hypothetical protein